MVASCSSGQNWDDLYYGEYPANLKSEVTFPFFAFRNASFSISGKQKGTWT